MVDEKENLDDIDDLEDFSASDVEVLEELPDGMPSQEQAAEEGLDQSQIDDLSGNDTPAWNPTMNVGGINYATGLFWQPLQNPEDPIPEIKEASEGTLEGADLFALRSGVASQYGLGVTDDGHRKGQISAAIAVSEALSEHQSSVAVFKVKEGWWYIAVRNDIILSDGDILFLNEDDAQRAFFSMMAVPDWGIKIAPQEWEIEGAVQIDIENVLKSSKQVKLQKIYGLRGVKLLTLIGVGAFLGLWLLIKIITGIFDFSSKPETPKFVPVKPKVIKKIENVPIVKPWEKLPNTVDILDSCWKNIYSLSLIPTPGWNIGNLTCSDKNISTNWVRRWGRISWMEESFNEKDINFLSKTFSDDGNNLIAIIKNNKIRITNSPPIKTKVEMINLVNDLFQSIGQPITLSSLELKVPDPNGGEAKTYQAVKFSFTSKHDPSLWVDLLAKFSGLHMQYIKYDPNNKTWGYEGQIYVL